MPAENPEPLPAAPKPSAPAGAVPLRGASGTASGSGIGSCAVLIADDDPAVRVVLRRLFARLGYGVATVGDGTDVLHFFRPGGYVGVFLDVQMPVMGGIETLRNIRGRDARVFIALMTEKDDPELARQAMELGANEWLVKPRTMEKLEETVLARLLAKAFPEEADDKPEGS